jgi:GNAT superfamily N-acetyltransferase
MEMRFAPVTFEEIAGAVRAHLAALPEAIDSFLEEHILASAHYRIVVDGESAGLTAIHDGSLITRFALAAPYRRFGQPIFARVRRLEQAQSAFVPTCDEFFLAHALDEYRQVTKQAYVFATARDLPPPPAFALRPAALADAEVIRRHAGDFFDELERRITAGEIFLTLRDGETVGFGILAHSALYDNVASIGMYTIEGHRRQGVGTATIALLIAACRRRGLRPVAGCWYYNHASKRTLERAGMYAPTRLLRIEY